MPSGDVFGCYLTDGRTVEHSFMVSLFRLVKYTKRLWGGEMAGRNTPSGGIATSRNILTQFWLDSTDAEWMWMIDSDMGFAPSTLDDLLDSAERTGSDAPVVGALCFAWPLDEQDALGGYRGRPQPTIYGYDGNGFKAVTTYPRDTLVKVGATGAACLLIHRRAAEEMREVYADDWWTPVRYSDGRMVSEDLSFFYRLGTVNRGGHVDTAIKTSHAKTIWVSEQDWFDHE